MQKSNFRLMVERILSESKLYKCMPGEGLIDIGFDPTESIQIINNPTLDQYKSTFNQVGIVRGIADNNNLYICPDDEFIHKQLLDILNANKLPIADNSFDIRDDGESLYVRGNTKSPDFNCKPLEQIFNAMGRIDDYRLAQKFSKALAHLVDEEVIKFKNRDTLKAFYDWIYNITKVDGFVICLDDYNLILDNLTIFHNDADQSRIYNAE